MWFFNKTYFPFLAPAWFGVFFLSAAWGQNILTVAGGGTPIPTPGTAGDGGPATLAVIGGPEDIALDSKGNLYIADGGYLLVRKVDAVTGVISTVAGQILNNNLPMGNGIPATQSTLNYPAGIAFDSQDNLYIADLYNNVVRKLSSASGTLTGACTITTVVGNGAATFLGDGGPASLAGLSAPEGLKFDNQGNLYIADFGNHVVRKVSPISGTITGACTITTVAGNGAAGDTGDNFPATSAELNGPHSLAFDGAGNLFITDDVSYVIRKVASGIIHTIAGSAGVTGFTPDGGPATLAIFSAEIDGLTVGCGGNLYLTDDFNQRVREIPAATGILTTIAGTGTAGYSNIVPPLSAQLNHPEAILFSHNSGDLFVANYSSGTIQKIAAYCTLTPVPTATPTPAPTAVGCGKPIETYCYPNPASGNTANILCNLCESGQVSIRIYNTAAELVETYSFQGNSGANTQPINIGGLSHGIYYYVVQAQGSTGTRKSDTSKFAVVR